jgi:hypothetical protein
VLLRVVVLLWMRAGRVNGGKVGRDFGRRRKEALGDVLHLSHGFTAQDQHTSSKGVA